VEIGDYCNVFLSLFLSVLPSLRLFLYPPEISSRASRSKQSVIAAYVRIRKPVGWRASDLRYVEKGREHGAQSYNFQPLLLTASLFALRRR